MGRLLVVYGFIGLSNPSSHVERLDWRYQIVIFWGGGLRAAQPLVLALSLPDTFEQRQLILNPTAAVVLFTLLVPGTTVGRLIRSLHLR